MQGGRFRKGVSGNPAGKPKGARHKATLAAEALLDGDSEKLTRKAITMALKGDPTAMRLCLERILPPRRDRPVRFQMPNMTTPNDIASAVGAVARAMGRGELTPEEATSVVAVLEIRRKALELVEIEARLLALEKSTMEPKR